MTDVTALLLSAASDHSDPDALDRAERALARDTWPAGSYWWIGTDCLASDGADITGSHQCSRVAVAERFIHPLTGETCWAWPCPGCGCDVGHTGEEIPSRHDPRCESCQFSCPPTQRAPSLSPSTE